MAMTNIKLDNLFFIIAITLNNHLGAIAGRGDNAGRGANA
jgi:hypothetical protein